MTEQEARQILGITEQTSWEEVLKVSSAALSLFFFFWLLLTRFKLQNLTYLGIWLRPL